MRAAFSYTMNQMGNGILLNERGQSLIDAAYASLGYRTNAPGRGALAARLPKPFVVRRFSSALALSARRCAAAGP